MPRLVDVRFAMIPGPRHSSRLFGYPDEKVEGRKSTLLVPASVTSRLRSVRMRCVVIRMVLLLLMMLLVLLLLLLLLLMLQQRGRRSVQTTVTSPPVIGLVVIRHGHRRIIVYVHVHPHRVVIVLVRDDVHQVCRRRRSSLTSSPSLSGREIASIVLGRNGF